MTQPILEVAPLSEMKGLINQWGNVMEEVLLIRGELHDQRKPVRSLLLL